MKRNETGSRGLVLDDFLSEMNQTEKRLQLRPATFGLKEIENLPGAKHALEKIISSAIKRNGPYMYSERHVLLTRISPNVYGQRARSGGLPRWRIRPNYLQSVLRVIIERALQVLVRMPQKDRKLNDG